MAADLGRLTVSVPPLVHGLANNLVAPDWPPVSVAELGPVLAHYGLRPRAVVWHSPRPLSSAALVDVGDRAVFVKRHDRRVRSADDLHAEHAFGVHLRDAGLPVPAVLPTSDGTSVVVDGTWTWEVHERGAGDDAYRDVPSWQPAFHPQHAHALGRTLAAVAQAAADYAAPPRPPALLVTSWQAVPADDLLDGVRQFVAARPAVAGALRGRDWERDVENALAPWHDALRPFLAVLPSTWTHGDGHPSNLLWRGDEVSALLDLGLADRTTPLLDLATAIERTCVSWLDDDIRPRLDLLDALLGGWSSLRPLSPADRQALARLLPLAHVEFALSEVGYYGLVVGSTTNVRIAYEDYLLGHARWFGSAHGQALLTAVA